MVDMKLDEFTEMKILYERVKDENRKLLHRISELEADTLKFPTLSEFSNLQDELDRTMKRTEKAEADLRELKEAVKINRIKKWEGKQTYHHPFGKEDSDLYSVLDRLEAK